MHSMFDPIINIIGTLCLYMSIVFTKMRSFHQMLQLSNIDLHFDFKISLQCNFKVLLLISDISIFM